MIAKAIILGGLGQMGRLITDSFLGSGVDVLIVDKRSPSGEAIPYLHHDVVATEDDRFQDVIRTADCVVACLPEDIALSICQRITALMRPATLWVDTLSVKSPITTALRSDMGRIEILSINPMFAPDLGWLGRPVAAIDLAPGPKSRSMIEFLTAWGANVEILTPEQHDDLTAAVQVATHAALLAYGSALLTFQYDARTALRVATPPHRVLTALLYRVVSLNPDVYYDIQRAHPQGVAVREALISALQCIDDDIKSGSRKQLTTLFSNVLRILNPEDQALASLLSGILRPPVI